MARIPVLNLSNINLTFGGDPLLSDLNLTVQPFDRVALVGRNGSGKSTVMKIMAGLIEPDSGERVLSPGLSVGYMEQDPDFTGFATIGDYAACGLDPGDEYRVERATEGLKLMPDTEPDKASGGERRRAALAKIIARAPDLMLLDEPTNHLDIEAIAWLEAHLSNSRSAFVLISHDRAFLKALSRATLWVDRGQMRRQDRGFEGFEEWRDQVFVEEDMQRHKLKRLIKAEARWAVEGISARRKRNQGRVRRLRDLRDERSAQIGRQGVAKLEMDSGPKSGRLVIEASSMCKNFGDLAIVNDFSLRIMRGERVALVGPNGSGKTTLINLLMKKIEPDAGAVRHGVGLLPAIFDQNRSALDPNASLWETLTEDRDLGVSGRNDQIMVRGVPRHVVGYLKDFLFDEGQARGPVRALSGGEKARLLLARLLARPSNILGLDEPTNDLDVETLDLLQEILAEYDGTVLLVSHDRDFLDRVATTTIAMSKGGRATAYAGGWSDYQSQREDDQISGLPKKTVAKKGGAQAERAQKLPPQQQAQLSYVEEHRLKTLPDLIAQLEAEIARLESFLSAPDLFQTAPQKFAKASEGLVERQAKLAAYEQEWLELEERAS
ncbi:MAG: ATP-binding cassette domain-containing protein [Alphaproteobacteria bacterium]|nr:ATP-binding cassette domain-containing protein [Alphaproteobacteria bacterium]